MKRQASENGHAKTTHQPMTGSGTGGLVPIAVLPGMDTLTKSETPELVAERYHLSLEKKRAERRLEEIDAILKARTGERQVGAYLVNVSSFNVERVDTDAVKEILGAKCPMKFTPTVRLTVSPA